MTCRNCGGDRAIHHYETMQCPVGGREAPVGRPQLWQDSCYEEEGEQMVTMSQVQKMIADALAAHVEQYDHVDVMEAHDYQ